MGIHRITFDAVKSRRTIKPVCVKCGKKFSRVLTTYQTINPFNKNADGTRKKASTIEEENSDKLDRDEEKMMQTFVCPKCV